MLPAQLGVISGSLLDRQAAVHTDSLPDIVRLQAVQARAMSMRTWLWIRCTDYLGDLNQALPPL